MVYLFHSNHSWHHHPPSLMYTTIFPTPIIPPHFPYLTQSEYFSSLNAHIEYHFQLQPLLSRHNPQSIIIVGFILTCESFAAPHRTFVGTLIENFWALGICLLPIFAFLFKNWVHLQLFISLAGLLSIPLYW